MGFLSLLLLVILLVLLFQRGNGNRSHEERLRMLEDQVLWLHRESQRLRAELAALKGEEAAASPAPESPPAFLPPEIPAEEQFQEAEPPSPVAAGTPAPKILERLLAGNILAKVGVVLLFFGVASGLRLAADYGYLPIQLRLLLGAVGGVAMVAFGWVKGRQGSRENHKAFAIALQGGGFAILYLIVYFMLARYGLLSATPAFLLFALLGLGCMALAVVQEGVALAVFGLAGAFSAPLLAASIGADPLPLFAYFSLLNAFIVGVAWFKAWPALNIAGFLLTIAVGMAWAVEHYHPGHYFLVQAFLLLFWCLYSVLPVLAELFQAPGRGGWYRGSLVFGTPLVAFALQSQLAGDRYELAWAAFGAALYYGALGLLLHYRRVLLPAQGYGGLALAFATLAVPLAFGVQVTAAFWALEGVAMVWFGTAQGRRLAVGAGALLRGAAGVYFLLSLPDMGREPPVFNDTTLGMVLLAGTGYASARFLREAALPALLWALAWWLGAGLQEIDRQTSSATGIVLELVFLSATLAFILWQGRRLGWKAAADAAVLPGGLLAAWLIGSNLTQPGAVVGLPYLPVLNAFDFAQLAGLAALYAWRRDVAAAAAFVWLSCLPARIAHHWAGVAFTPRALWHSSLVQAQLTFLWTLAAIAAMILAARRGRRPLWQGGFSLLAVVGAKLMLVDLANAGTLVWTGSLIGVALLVLVAAYFAPMPPRNGAGTNAGTAGSKEIQ